MRLIHRLRLTRNDAAQLDFLYLLAHAKTGASAKVQAERHAALQDFAAKLFYSRTLTRPVGWKWSYNAATLYISAI